VSEPPVGRLTETDLVRKLVATDRYPYVTTVAVSSTC
jgi:hypothetical protein